MSQERSKTAVIATIAAEMRGVPGAEQPRWFETELGVAIGGKGRKGALHRRKALSPLDSKKGRKGSDPPSTHAPDGWIWDAVGVNVRKLDLEQVLAVFAPLAETDQLVGHLQTTLGVVEIIETYGDGLTKRVIARVIYSGPQRRAEINDRLRAAEVGFEWWSVRRVLPDRPFEEFPAGATWAALARQIAEVEGHAIDATPPA